MKKFFEYLLIILVAIAIAVGAVFLVEWLVTDSSEETDEVIGDDSDFDDEFSGSTSTQEDGKEDDGNSSSDLPSEDNPSESNVYFTLPDKFTSGDYVLDLNERVQVVPYCYPDYTYFTEYIVWTSSNPSVVSITPLEDLVSSCYLIGESEGYSTITATYEDQSISFEVGVSTLFGVVNEYVYIYYGEPYSFTSGLYECDFELAGFCDDILLVNDCSITCTSGNGSSLTISTVYFSVYDGDWYVHIDFPKILGFGNKYSFECEVHQVLESAPYVHYVRITNFNLIIRSSTVVLEETYYV